MANEAISQMPAAATLTGTELIELVQGGVNVQSTAAALAALSTGGVLSSTLTADYVMTSTTALAQVAGLTVTIPNTASQYYAVDALIAFYEQTSSAGGIQLAFGGGATVAGGNWSYNGFITGGDSLNILAFNSVLTAASISTNNTAPSWIWVRGNVLFTSGGTFGVKAAQDVSSANPTHIMSAATGATLAGSHIILTPV